MKQLGSYFLQGLLYVAPIGITIYIIVISILGIDNLLTGLEIFQKGGALHKFSFPGMGVIVILTLVTLIGFLGQKLIATPLSGAMEKGITKTPLVKIIYTSVKDLLSAFVGKEKKFDKPVLVQLDNAKIMHRVGFITATSLEEFGIVGMVGVYLPSSYGFVGDFFVLPVENIKPIDANSTDVMKLIVSGGVSSSRKSLDGSESNELDEETTKPSNQQ